MQAYDADGTVQYCNKASEKVYGYTEAEAVGKSLYDLVIPEEAKEFVRENVHAAVTRSIGIPAGELMLRHKDGSCVVVYSSHVVIRASGEEPQLFCVDIDMKDLKSAEAALHHSIEIQTVLREIADAAVSAPSLDEMYRIVYGLVRRVLPAKLFHINLLDDVAGEIVVPFSSDELNTIPARRPLDNGMTEYILRLGHAVHVTPAELDRLITASAIVDWLQRNDKAYA